MQAWEGPDGSRNLRTPESRHSACEGGKVVKPNYRPPLFLGDTLVLILFQDYSISGP